MQQTNAYATDSSSSFGRYSPAAALPFFKSRLGLLTLLAAGSGLYLYQRRGGSFKTLFSRIWDLGLSARNSIGSVAPSVSGGTTDATGDVGTFGAGDISASGIGNSTTRQSSPNSGI